MMKDIERNFMIGDEWLYYKVYSGPKTIEKILREKIAPTIKSLITDNIIDRWFFIRYADPQHHIRIRFHLTNKLKVGQVINQLNSVLKDDINQDFISKIQTDTYQREVERYGQSSMELSEELFYHDSQMIIEFLQQINNDKRAEELRWLFALKVIDTHLNIFQYSNEDKQQILYDLKTLYRGIYDNSNYLNKQLGGKYRANRFVIEEFMNQFKTEKYENLNRVLQNKITKIKPLVNKLLEIKNGNELEIDFNSLNTSYIHMFMNRLFKSKNNIHEMVCYDFLFQYNKSNLARLKKSHKSKNEEDLVSYLGSNLS